MLDEATKYGRSITKAEIDLWFETFQRCTLDDFKRAWVEHKRDDKNGHFFPKIPWLQRQLKLTSAERPETDWRCCEEVGGQRCNWPGGINAGRGWQCAAHWRLCGSVEYTPATSLQIIEASANYTPPKTPMELMELGEKLRAIDGERWRASHPDAYQVPRKPEDALAPPRIPAKPELVELEAPVLEDVNAQAQMAAAEEV
jgi:hypothetical protein